MAEPLESSAKDEASGSNLSHESCEEKPLRNPDASDDLVKVFEAGDYEPGVFVGKGPACVCLVEGVGLVKNFLPSEDLNECVDEILGTKSKYLHSEETKQRIEAKKL